MTKRVTKESVQRCLPRGVTLQQRSNRGKRVWAGVTARHARGLHKYTLSDGSAVWDWWPTLTAAKREACKQGR